MVNKKLDKLIDKELEHIIEIRKDIHSYPELGMQEHRTSQIIVDNLCDLDLKIEKGIGKTGVVALLKGNKYDKTLILRADIAIKGLNKFIGRENVTIIEKLAAGGEDFSFFNKHVPCIFMWLGCKLDMNKDCCTIHNPNFICDEKSIPIGIKSLCGVTLEYLK